MRKVLITIIVLITLLCSGGFAQSPNSFSVVLDKKISDWVTVPCKEAGFCVVAEKKLKENKQLIINHFDTTMHTVFDTIFTLSLDYQSQFVFYENGALVVFYRNYNKRQVGQGTLLLYHLDSKTIDSVDVSNWPSNGGSGWWRHYNGNIFFTDKGKHGDQVWFLPAGTTQPQPFSFTQENHGEVIAINVDTTHATIGWGFEGNPDHFEAEYGPQGFAQGSGTTVGTTESFLHLSNLQPDTYYDLYVRCVCDEDLYGEWDMLTFHTDTLIHTGIRTVADDILQIYPNPAQGQCTVQFEREKPSVIRLFTLEGSLVQEIIPTKETLELALPASGVYLLVCEMREGTVTRKIVSR